MLASYDTVKTKELKYNAQELKQLPAEIIHVSLISQQWCMIRNTQCNVHPGADLFHKTALIPLHYSNPSCLVSKVTRCRINWITSISWKGICNAALYKTKQHWLNYMNLYFSQKIAHWV